MAPPMTRTAFARRKVVGDSEATRARLVRGPMATMVMVSGGFSERIRRISRWDSILEGVKSVGESLGCTWVVAVAVAVRSVSAGGRSNRCFHVSSGLV